jgi:hypothetical protein
MVGIPRSVRNWCRGHGGRSTSPERLTKKPREITREISQTMLNKTGLHPLERRVMRKTGNNYIAKSNYF